MKVLICLDYGDTAELVLRESNKLLRNFPNTHIEVFTVSDVAMVSTGGVGDGKSEMDKLESESSELKDLIRKVFEDADVHFSSTVGYPAEKIVEKVEQTQCDLLVLGTHGRTGLDHLIVGSVCEKVLRHITCNTFVIPIKGRI